MSLLIIFPFLLAIILGVIVTNRLSISIPNFSRPFFVIVLGTLLYTAVVYFLSLFLSFPLGVNIANWIILLFVIFYFLKKKEIKTSNFFLAIYEEKWLFFILVFLGIILFSLFNTHIIPSINSNLYTGESTYGDLPFHLSIISEIAYGGKFPPENPFFSGLPLVYPYLINFYSAILVSMGMSLRNSIIIPGIILSLSLIGIFYDFVFAVTKSSLKSFLATLLYFLNGGAGFYFFLKDNAFSLLSIFKTLQNPYLMKEYSHLFDQNIQWPNFLSRMIIPERSLLFGIPAGLIILRLLYFRNSEEKPTFLELIIISILLALMPLLHTHTALVMAIILPIFGLAFLKKNSWKTQIYDYFFIIGLTSILLTPSYQLFLNQVGGSNNFFKFHLWWMSGNESPINFWFKNSYLLILLSLTVFINKIGGFSLKILEICALTLLVLVNLFLFQPYNWDNVKLLLWAGIFFSISLSAFLAFLLSKKKVVLNLLVLFIFLSSIFTALISIYREINVSYILFSKDTVEAGNYIKNNTSLDSIFLTYKIHNSPVNNLAGRSILMGYSGLLWVHGIDYSQRDKDINLMYSGLTKAQELFNKYNVNYVVLGPGFDKNIPVNLKFFQQFPLIYKNDNFSIYKIK